MSNLADRIEEEALQLSLDRRARLARRLLESLDQEAGEDPEAVERAWEAEIERRVARYRSGESGPTVPASKVFQESRERLNDSTQVTDVSILPEAREEFLAAVEYYNAASPGLGEEFISDVENAMSRIRSFPTHGSPGIGGTRRVLLGRFPFDVVYVEDEAEAVVIAVAHQRRSPSYWRDRLQMAVGGTVSHVEPAGTRTPPAGVGGGDSKKAGLASAGLAGPRGPLRNPKVPIHAHPRMRRVGGLPPTALHPDRTLNALGTIPHGAGG